MQNPARGMLAADDADAKRVVDFVVRVFCRGFGGGRSVELGRGVRTPRVFNFFQFNSP